MCVEVYSDSVIHLDGGRTLRLCLTTADQDETPAEEQRYTPACLKVWEEYMRLFTDKTFTVEAVCRVCDGLRYVSVIVCTAWFVVRMKDQRCGR